MRGVTRFGIKGKLAPRYVGPFEIIEKIGDMAYCLTWPPQLIYVHDVFHGSMLKKYIYARHMFYPTRRFPYSQM